MCALGYSLYVHCLGVLYRHVAVRELQTFMCYLTPSTYCCPIIYISGFDNRIFCAGGGEHIIDCILWV